METIKAFCKRKNIEVSAKRYGIDALGAMAQGLFCSLLIGTIIKTLGAQLGVPFLTDIGTYAMSVSGPAMAVAIGYALKADPMVLFSLAAVGYAANAEGGAGGPLAVLIIAVVAGECGKAVSKETKIDILVTPAVTILVGVALAKWIAPPIGTAASANNQHIHIVFYIVQVHILGRNTTVGLQHFAKLMGHQFALIGPDFQGGELTLFIVRMICRKQFVLFLGGHAGGLVGNIFRPCGFYCFERCLKFL